MNNGSIRISANGYPTLSYRLLVSTNLISTNWQTVATTTANTAGALTLVDSNAMSQTPRFYRLVTP